MDEREIKVEGDENKRRRKGKKEINEGRKERGGGRKKIETELRIEKG